MTPDQIKIVQDHFIRFYPIKDVFAKTFYDRLFEIAPEARPLFPEKMAQQREKLADTLAFVVRNLNNLDQLILTAQGLGRRHVSYGARPEHFTPVGEALLFALDHHSPGGMPPAEREAWGIAYAMIVQEMLVAMNSQAA